MEIGYRYCKGVNFRPTAASSAVNSASQQLGTSFDFIDRSQNDALLGGEVRRTLPSTRLCR
jgi:hypothetical protein